MTRRPRIAGPGRPRLAVPVALLAAALMLSVPGIAGPPSRAGAAATPTVSALRIPSAPLRDAPSAAPTPGEAARVTPGVTPGVPPSFQWFNLTPYSSPPGRYGAAMTYDLEDQYVLLFGGESAATATPLGDTWSYVSGDWKEICPGNFGGSACDDGPPPSSDSSMAYDPNSSEVVDYDFARALTFGFAQGVWVNLTGPERPPAQQFPSGIAYDPVDGRMLILSASGVTFELDGPNWTEAPVTGAHPSARTGAVLFSDTLLGKVVLSGGVEGSQPLTDTWEFGNGTWQAVATASSPPGSEAAAFDETYEDGAVLAEAPGSDTLVLWGFSASGWSRVAEVGSTAPTPSGEPSLTFDAHDGYLLLYWGGAVGAPLGLTAPSNTWAAVDAFTGENVTVSRPAVVVGDTFWIHAYAAGGELPYTYTYAVLPPGCSGSSFRAEVPCPTFEVGTFPITVTVRDGVFGASTLLASITVVPLPTAAVVTLTNPTTAGRPVDFEGSVTGGLAPFSLRWNFSDGLFAAGPNPSHVFRVAGVFNVTVTVANGSGVTENASLLEVVNPIPRLTGISATPNVTDVGEPVSFSSSIAGGTAPFGYSWSFGAGQGTGAGPDPEYAYTASGSYFATVTANDSVGGGASRSVPVLVNPDPVAAILASVAPFNLTVGLAVAISGGTAPYALIWSLGDGSVSSNGSVEHLYAGAGTYVVSVTVRDGAGWELVQSVNLTVESPLTPPAIAWYNGTVGTALALFGLAGIGLAGFAILVRRLLEEEPATPPRRRPPSKPPIALFGPEVGPPGEQPRAGAGEYQRD